MKNDLICPICGEPTRIYMGNARKDKLCGKHADMLKAGEINVDSAGTYIDLRTKKILNKLESKKEETKINTITEKMIP